MTRKYHFAVLLILVLFLFNSTDSINHLNLKEDSYSSYSGITQKKVKSYHNNYVNIFSLKREGQNIGHAIWMKRQGTNNKVKAKYFAYKNQKGNTTQTVHDRYSQWVTNKIPILSCSGAFSDDYPGNNNPNLKPIGITVDDGRIVNRNIDFRMDGLVVVTNNGGMLVSDIQNKNFKIGNQVLDVVRDKAKLLNWAQKNRSTIFQTQLLVFQNSLRISRAGRKKQRERRFLALAKSSSQNLYHIIIDLPNNNHLFDASRDIFNFLSEDLKMNVIALLNLDTGSFNIMELYDSRGRRDYLVTGDTDIELATNLVTYYYEY